MPISLAKDTDDFINAGGRVTHVVDPRGQSGEFDLMLRTIVRQSNDMAMRSFMRDVPVIAGKREAVAVSVAERPYTPWIVRLGDLLESMFGNRRASPAVRAKPAPAQTPWLIRFGDWLDSIGNAPEEPTQEAPVIQANGATTTHYRAFSIVSVRLQKSTWGKDKLAKRSERTIAALTALRVRTKTIKTQDRVVQDEALGVLDTFVKYVDAFAPLWDAAAMNERGILLDGLVDTIAKLDDELKDVLTAGAPTRDRLDTVTRFIEQRYVAEGTVEDYGLSAI